MLGKTAGRLPIQSRVASGTNELLEALPLTRVDHVSELRQQKHLALFVSVGVH